MWADDQVETLMNMPGISYATIQAAKGFPKHVRDLDKSRVYEMNQGRKREATVKVKELSTQVSEDHARLEELTKTLQSRVGYSLNVLSEVEQINARLASVERTHDALTASESRMAEMEADPSGYMEVFYSKYPGLLDRRITLAQYLAERGHYAR